MHQLEDNYCKVMNLSIVDLSPNTEMCWKKFYHGSLGHIFPDTLITNLSWVLGQILPNSLIINSSWFFGPDFSGHMKINLLWFFGPDLVGHHNLNLS